MVSYEDKQWHERCFTCNALESWWSVVIASSNKDNLGNKRDTPFTGDLSKSFLHESGFVIFSNNYRLEISIIQFSFYATPTYATTDLLTTIVLFIAEVVRKSWKTIFKIYVCQVQIFFF